MYSIQKLGKAPFIHHNKIERQPKGAQPVSNQPPKKLRKKNKEMAHRQGKREEAEQRSQSTTRSLGQTYHRNCYVSNGEQLPVASKLWLPFQT